MKQYKTLSEWKKDNPKEYNKANRSGDLHLICEVHGWEIRTPRGYWTKERCIEDAKKYDTVKEWIACKGAAYDKSKKMGWYQECIEHMDILRIPGEYWTKEKCLEEARKYKTRGEWHAANRSAYIAKKNGWFDECVAHMKVMCKSWSKESVFAEAKKHETKYAWSKSNSRSYKLAKENGWFDECCEHMIEVSKPFGYWTKEKCIEEARKYKSVKDWREHSQTTYQRARVNSWLEECISHLTITIKPRGYWTKEKCLEEARKYKNKKDWREKSSGSYNSACKKGCLKECTEHMDLLIKPVGYWTKEKCLEEALKYKTKTKWQRGPHSSSYSAAYNYGWFDECTKHMK